jgi:hypothetical protein
MWFKDFNPNDCLACGLPIPMCSCSYPDAVYYPVEHARLDIRIERAISPEEGMSDYTRTRAFTEAYLYGRDGKW